MSATSLQPQTTTIATGHSNSLRPKTASPRRHDLDALRAIAMLLGIVLHAALSFSSIPWTVKDSQQSQGFDILFAAIHGFRMPLFFLLSGFFTAMLWRRRGLSSLLKHRLKRIGLPLLIGCFTIIPAMWFVSWLVSESGSLSPTENQVWAALEQNDVESVRTSIDQGEIDANAMHPDSGATLLSSAVFYGHLEMVEMLLEQGADANWRNNDEGTALHTAAFMGRADSAKALLQAGADPDIVDVNSQTAQQLLTVDFGTTSFIAAQYGAQLNEEELISGRAKIADALGTNLYLGSEAVDPSAAQMAALTGLLFYLPVFMHLWFLWFLCWLVLAFVAYTWLTKIVKIQSIPKWLFCSPIAMLWLVPLTLLPQLVMQPGVFGPDSSVGLLPIPSVLAYYAIFFFFGAVYWDMDDRQGKLGRWWFVSLPIALFVVLPIALDVVSGTFGGRLQPAAPLPRTLLSTFLQSLFAWLMITGSIGGFRDLFPKESKVLRYISDSSYWLYLIHLPFILLAQWFVQSWNAPALVKFALVTVTVFSLLLISYQLMVRYTFIGRILNGTSRVAVAGVSDGPNLRQ